MQYLKFGRISILLFGIVWFAITGLILFIDYLGVNVLNKNGLVFQIHCYSYGLTFFIASIAFVGTIKRVTNSSFKFAILLGTVAGGVWWFLTFCILMMGFHGSMGGWY
jgi:hypothetical protein